MKHLGVLENSLKYVSMFQIELEFGSVGFLRRGENWSTQRKTSRSKGENQRQTQPTYGIDASYYKTMQTVWIYLGVSIDTAQISWSPA